MAEARFQEARARMPCARQTPLARHDMDDVDVGRLIRRDAP